MKKKKKKKGTQKLQTPMFYLLKKEINSNKKYNNSYLINVKSFISYS